MKNKKNKLLPEPMGGIEIKYGQQINDMIIEATVVLLSSFKQIKEWEDDGWVRDYVYDWLNGPLKEFNRIKSDFDVFVNEVMADPAFSDQDREEFQQSFVSTMNKMFAFAQELDHYVMTGELS